MQVKRSFISDPNRPSEVLDWVLSYLPIAALATVSRLSWAWQARAFPHLYKTISLAFLPHLKRIAKRAALDSGGPLSLTENVTGLSLRSISQSIYGRKPIKEDDLDCLSLLVPKLTQLQRLTWALPFFPDDMEIMSSLQSHCPQLESFNILLEQKFSFYRNGLHASLFNLKNLTEILIKSLSAPIFLEFEDCVQPLTGMLVSSPNLTSLVLDLTEYKPTFSPNLLLASLGNKIKFPHLRLLQLRGCPDPDWVAFTRSKKHPLRAFLARHPTIEDLVLGWVPHGNPDLELDQVEAAALFPSLRLFRGPAFICAAIVRTRIAARLESLFIADEVLYHPGDNIFEDSLTKVACGVTSLPKLKRLIIAATSFTQAWVLDKLSDAAPNLEELDFKMIVDNYLELWDTIARAPSLQSLTVSDAFLEIAREAMEEDRGEDEGEVEVEDVIKSMVSGNTSLQTVQCRDGLAGIWEIDRVGGQVRAFQVGFYL